MYKSADQIGGVFAIIDPATGALIAADAPGPVGTLEINGTDHAATVTIGTTAVTGKYTWSCTLPAGISDGQNLEIWISAAVTVAGGNKVWVGVGCTKRPADVFAAIASVGAVAAAVWAYATRTLTQAAAAVAAALAGSTITVRRGDTLTVSITGLGSVANRTKLWIAAKADRGHPDTAAVFVIEETAKLQVINGTPATTAANGTLTVTDAAAGDLTIVLAGVETAKLAELTGGFYDIQVLETAGPRTLTDGTLAVTLDVTRATS